MDVKWFKVINDLKKAGISGREIARRLDVSPATVAGWKSGSTPGYYSAIKLLDLWTKKVKSRN